MASAGAKYAHDEVESERPLKVCAEAGRKCVRNIHLYPVLSVEWIALVDSLKQLMRLVHLEGRMPMNTKVSEAQGRNKDSDGTLWDQEQHENAIRILVEEAKVNLCLRMMNDFKKWQYDPVQSQQTIREAIQAYELNEVQLDQKCMQFEESLGMLLMRAFMHVETLQLMDIPLLIEHCAMVFEYYAKKPGEPANAKMQETVVLYYFSALMKHAEALNNSELLAKSKDHMLVHLATKHILNFGEKYLNLDLLVTSAEGFAALADNEDFSSRWKDYFADAMGEPDAEKMASFLELEKKVVEPILKEKPESKKNLRPLLDFFAKVQRELAA